MCSWGGHIPALPSTSPSSALTPYTDGPATQKPSRGPSRAGGLAGSLRQELPPVGVTHETKPGRLIYVCVSF